MKKIFLIGNSHVSTWAGEKVWRNIYKYIVQNINGFDIYFLCNIPSGAWNVHMDDSKMLKKLIEPVKNLIDEESVVFACWGDHDVRNHLPEKKNAEYNVEKYVAAVMEYFKEYNCKVRFIEPIPVIKDRARWEELDPKSVFNTPFDIEVQKEQYLIFIEALKNNCIKYGLPEPIKIQNNIISEEFLLDEETYDGCHLKIEKSEVLIKYLINKVKSNY